MSANNIQIVNVQFNAIPHVARSEPTPEDIRARTYGRGMNYNQAVANFREEERYKARNPDIRTTVQIRNTGSQFHNVALLINKTENGIGKDSYERDFGTITPNLIVERQVQGGVGWQISGIKIDGQYYPRFYSLEPPKRPEPTTTGGKFLRFLGLD